MLTIFSIPKAFTEPHTRIIQRNALFSWTKIPGCQVILLGDDEGVKEAAEEFGTLHIREVEKTEYGTPLLHSAFRLAKEAAKYDVVMYVNADIIFTEDLLSAEKYFPEGEFLMVGRRTDFDITEEIDRRNPLWEEDLREKVMGSGKLHSHAGIDYFIFRKDSFANLPPFAVGRVGWDNWMIAEARRKKIPVIDATEIILAVHQNHDYPSFNKNKERKTNPEALKNLAFTKHPAYFFTIEDADWKLTPRGLKRKYFSRLPFFKRYAKEKLKFFRRGFSK